MSSPRKYASPYLTSVPGLPPASNKMKKRSKTSISKSNEVDAESEETKSPVNNEAEESKPPPKAGEQEPKFDAASGDMDKTTINDIIKGTKSISISPTEDTKVQQNGKGEGEGNKVQESISTDGAKVLEKSENISSSTKTDENSPQAKLPDTIKDDQSSPSVALKSILKKPSLYRVKSKGKDVSSDAIRKSTAKTSKSRSGKFSKDSMLRAQAIKQKTGAAAGSASSSKADVKSQAQGNLSSKSPRRKGRPTQGKPEEKEEVPVSPKKTVRFSTRVDVHPVPYESRAGTRACDWQRNMLEQRVQTFRQLMKDVGTDEIDLFGSGMLFPGYPYHLPNPNFALRGARVRNFKL